MAEEKSILDNVEKKITADDSGVLSRMFPEAEKATRKEEGIVGSCPHCGAPIYGPRWIAENEEPKVRYSCNCYRPSHNVQQQMEHKTK